MNGWPFAARDSRQTIPSSLSTGPIVSALKSEIICFGFETVAVCANALDAAAERVKKRFGYYCSAANTEKEKIIYKHAQLKQANIHGVVIITSMKTANQIDKELSFKP